MSSVRHGRPESVTDNASANAGRSDELRVRLFGAPAIEAGGRPVETDTRKATALLACLVLSGVPQRRASLAALLWPEAGDEHARAALRRTLSVLRSALGDRWLVVDGDTIRLDDTGLWADVREFRALLGMGRLRDAISLYRGDLLAGFSVRDSEPFDEWQRTHAEALRDEARHALTRLAHDAATGDDLHEAIAWARRRLVLDPLDEAAHTDLMRLHLRAGDRSAALRQYHECARVLDRELGVAPLAATRALRDAIESGELPVEERSSELAPAEAAGDAHTLHGDYRRAIASYEGALRTSSLASRARVEHKLAQVHHRRGDWRSAERHYAAAADAAASEGERSRVIADRSLAAQRSGDVALARRLAGDALRLATRSGDRRALAQAHNILGILTARDDPATARRHLATSVRIAEEIGDLEQLVAVLNNLALAHRRSGEFERAREVTERALAYAIELGDRHHIAALHNNLADALRDLGDTAESMRHLKRSVTLFSEIGGSTVAEPEVWKLVEW